MSAPSSRVTISSQLLRSLLLQAIFVGAVTTRALAKKFRLSEATVRSHLSALQSAGRIRVSALRVVGSKARVYEVVR